jgi:hypothetical protein
MRLMSTSKDSLGMAHPNAREGDRVMYLQGCSIPVILRETAARENATSKMFSVVGGAYLHWEQHESYDACCKFVKTGLWEKGVSGGGDFVLIKTFFLPVP